MQIRLNVGTTDSVGGLSSLSALDAAALPRHRWYFFKEAFSPSVVSRAIEDTGCTEDDLVLDPFSGSGTVPLSSSIVDRPAISFEVNPFLAFVSRAKLLRIKRSTLERYADAVYSGAERGRTSPLETFSTFSKAGGADKWLFNAGVLRAFEGGWTTTQEMYPPARDLLRLSLIGAAMDVCNATKDGKCLRYRKDWDELNHDGTAFAAALHRRVSQIAEDVEAERLGSARARVHTADAREAMPKKLGQRRFKLCVTSPPYLNSFDYTDVYRPELFLGKFVRSMDELRALRLRTLRSHTQVKWDDPSEEEFGPHFSPSYNEIKARTDALWNRRIPAMIRAYFEDMRTVLRDLKRMAADDASVWIVVSTSAYAGVEIPVDLIIADIGTQEGWCLREVSVMRHLRRVPVQQWEQLAERSDRKKPHLRESIVILDAQPRTASPR
jgi:DNA modification methylase